MVSADRFGCPKSCAQYRLTRAYRWIIISRLRFVVRTLESFSQDRKTAVPKPEPENKNPKPGPSKPPSVGPGPSLGQDLRTQISVHRPWSPARLQHITLSCGHFEQFFCLFCRHSFSPRSPYFLLFPSLASCCASTLALSRAKSSGGVKRRFFLLCS